MSEDVEKKRATSRKWAVTVWAMSVGTLLVLFAGFCALMDKEVPSGFGGLATLLFGTGIAYIGGNVWQKQILANAEKEGDE